MLTTPDVIALAEQLGRLRHDGDQVPTAQLVSLPLAFQDAMEVQSQLSKLEGAEASAWKVAKSPDGIPIAAPLHPYLDDLSDPTIAWRKTMKIEVEIAVKLHQELPVRVGKAYERADIEAAICEAYLGAELVWSAVSEGGAVSFPAFLADRLGNLGYVRGPTLPLEVLEPGWNSPLKLWLNGQVAFDAAGQHPTKDVLTWLCDYANNPSRPAAALGAGAIVTTGSLCGAIEVTDPGDVSIRLGETAVLSFALAREPAVVKQGARSDQA